MGDALQQQQEKQNAHGFSQIAILFIQLLFREWYVLIYLYQKDDRFTILSSGISVMQKAVSYQTILSHT